MGVAAIVTRPNPREEERGKGGGEGGERRGEERRAFLQPLPSTLVVGVLYSTIILHTRVGVAGLLRVMMVDVIWEERAREQERERFTRKKRAGRHPEEGGEEAPEPSPSLLFFF